jgi:AraC family transcriptional regulator
MGGSKNTIYNSISAIENRLSEELSIQELAEQAYFSKTHYKRLFLEVVGQPVMEYIKKRRLQRAAVVLCESGFSVLDVALSFGYASHEGFSRAFKEHFGMPPLQYRKRYSTAKSYHEEAANMVTNEARTNITRYTEDIAKDLETLISKLETIREPVPPVIEKAGRNALGMKVSFTEWSHLIRRLKTARDEIRKIPAENETVYELYDKADKIIKTLDETNFQMNLLRLLTGVEWTRMGEHGISFEPAIKELTILCNDENNSKEAAVKLVAEINTQVQAEIRREAVGCIQQAADNLRKAVAEGASLTEKLNKLVIDMGAYGGGFALIAKETEKSTACAREAEVLTTELAAALSKSDVTAFQVSDDIPAHMAIGRLEDAAFSMNLNAFNIAIESARAGDRDDCAACAKGVMEYAGQLQNAVMTCGECYNDYARLKALLCKKTDEQTATDCMQKRYADIIFHAGLLTAQLRLESARTGREDIIALSQDFEKALDTLRNEHFENNEQTNKSELLAAYIKNALALLERGNTIAEAAGEYGCGIAYILKEFIFLKMCYT